MALSLELPEDLSEGGRQGYNQDGGGGVQGVDTDQGIVIEGLLGAGDRCDVC